MPHGSLKDFFSDCPWLGVPAHRRAIIVEEPLLPRSRLLGGSSKDGKISKLAALAAKRRKEKESKQSSEASQAPSNDYAERLRQLHVSQPRAKSESAQDSAAGIEVQKKHDADGPGPDASESAQSHVDLPEAGIVQHLRRPPSAFATVLTQPSQGFQTANSLLSADNLAAESAFDFSQPSPDDVFRRAQGAK
jgi:elongation factor 1 alpha-like protein